MTVYSHAIGSNDLINAKISSKVSFKAGPARLNLALLCLAVLFLAGYVFLSNFLTSQKYLMNVHKSELNQLGAISASNNQDADSQALNELMFFAQRSGMVEAKDFGVILENNNFALSKTN